MVVFGSIMVLFLCGELNAVNNLYNKQKTSLYFFVFVFVLEVFLNSKKNMQASADLSYVSCSFTVL